MKAAAIALLLCSVMAWGQNSSLSNPGSVPQSPANADPSSNVQSAEHKGAWDIGVWGAGGHSVAGGTKGVSLGSAGVRVGKILTAEHGSGWYRGNFEYAVDLIPVYAVALPARVAPCKIPLCTAVFFPSKTVYGGGFNPFVAKWNFTAPRTVSPYFELNGGVLFTNTEVPQATSNINFMSSAVLGMNVFASDKHAWSFDIKYVHISNAGLATPNPGINTVQGEIGFHWFK